MLLTVGLIDKLTWDGQKKNTERFLLIFLETTQLTYFSYNSDRFKTFLIVT